MKCPRPSLHFLITKEREGDACPERGQNFCFHGTCKKAQLPGSHSPAIATGLANSCATAIDQEQQHDNKKYTGNNPNNSDIVHANSPCLSVV
jgi:hypothetical protein